MGFIELSFNLFWAASGGILSIFVFLLDVLVVEISIGIVLIVHPCSNLVGILFVEVTGGWNWVQENVLAVEANMVSLKSLITPKHHLSPQIGVLSTLVHSSIWLEVLLNKVLVLVKGCLDLFLTCLVLENLVKVSPHGILLLMESVEVHSLDGVNVHGHQLTESTPTNDKAIKRTYL